jgi:hypothetical protein
MHYTHTDPSRSNLPRDPATGRIKAGPGRRKGQPNVVSRLAKDGINQVFEELGGVEGMVKWCRRSPKNLYAFYVHIWPRLLAAQNVDAAEAMLAEKPRIGVRRRSWGGVLPLGRHASISGSRLIHAPSVSIAPSLFQERQNARNQNWFKLEQTLTDR